MNDILLAWLPYILPTVVTLGTALAFRQNYSKSVAQIQTQLNAAYKEENELLQKQLVRSNRIMAAMRYALKELDMHVRVNGAYVSVYNARTQRKKIIQIPQSFDTTSEEDILEEEDTDEHQSDD